MRFYTEIVDTEILKADTEQREAADLGIDAADRLLSRLGWKKEEIKVLIYGTQSPKFLTPSTASYIFKGLKLETDCVTYDIDLGAAAFQNGLQIVSLILESFGKGQRGLLLLGEDDRMGDLGLQQGQSAVVAIAMEAGNGSLNIWHRQYSEFYDKLYRKEKAERLKNTVEPEDKKKLQVKIEAFCYECLSQLEKDGKRAFIINDSTFCSEGLREKLAAMEIDMLPNPYDGGQAAVMVPFSLAENSLTSYKYMSVCTISAGITVSFADILL